MEKELLLKEIHHRVKNNLQITAGLFSLQAGSVKEESVREAFRENENRIKSMALVHEKLYQSGNLGQVNIRDYIDSLATGVLRSYDDRSRRIKLNLDIPETHLPIDKALPFGLIVNELIANSIKHAFEPGKLGEINIVIRSADDFIVSVADNGKGLPPHLNVAETQSLGLKLVSMLTKQLHGSVTIGRGPGAEVLIRFPLGGN
ncbi:MAG TPA: sensor histidine kinase [Planctomycetota bacterium]|nr:sensor histidine kinase [Planctomycetota bacterium]